MHEFSQSPSETCLIYDFSWCYSRRDFLRENYTCNSPIDEYNYSGSVYGRPVHLEFMQKEDHTKLFSTCRLQLSFENHAAAFFKKIEHKCALGGYRCPHPIENLRHRYEHTHGNPQAPQRSSMLIVTEVFTARATLHHFVPFISAGLAQPEITGVVTARMVQFHIVRARRGLSYLLPFASGNNTILTELRFAAAVVSPNSLALVAKPVPARRALPNWRKTSHRTEIANPDVLLDTLLSTVRRTIRTHQTRFIPATT
jgi:hypothetical protein